MSHITSHPSDTIVAIEVSQFQLDLSDGERAPRISIESGKARRDKRFWDERPLIRNRPTPIAIPLDIGRTTHF